MGDKDPRCACRGDRLQEPRPVCMIGEREALIDAAASDCRAAASIRWRRRRNGSQTVESMDFRSPNEAQAQSIARPLSYRGL
jgi:hypothetical protein